MRFSSIKSGFKSSATVLCFLFLTVTVLSCTGAERLHTVSITIEAQKSEKSVTLTVETAVTAQEQQHGFMRRNEVPDGTGMIFIYKRDETLRFWMKDTPHPLSIAFIDSAGRIREIYDMQPFSLDIISSTYSVRYALEVAQGYFERAGIGLGDRLSADSLERLKAATE